VGFFQLSTPESMLEKAKRELTRLEAGDSNFFVTAYHIVDYLDGRLAKPVVDAIRADQLIRFCGDACNTAKHMRLDPDRGRPPIEADIRFKGALFNTAPYNTFAFNQSRVERWIIWEEDGGTRKSLEVAKFARDVIAKWDELFVKHGIGQ
jgi:hypothetical protein